MTARSPRRPIARRRGVTLVEMLVTVGLLVLVMTILVQIFRSATGALSAQRAFAGLDQDIRRVDTFLRQDLAGTTAKMTPPNNPRDGTGYFTYGENALADLQGEDTDDYLAFTAKAPAGRPFTGTMAVPSQRPGAGGMPVTYKRVPISSDFAEVVYFLRNGNLYRRVFLILPKDQQGAIHSGLPLGASGWGYDGSLVVPGTGLYGLPTGWLGLNDLSARPSPYPAAIGGAPVPPGTVPILGYAPRLNSLGDLTNREHRAFNPRFANDYVSNDPSTGAVVFVPDGIPDDTNGDGVPDFYPTMYPNLRTRVGVNATALTYYHALQGTPAFWTRDIMGFPFVYPNAYSRPETFSAAGGAMHSLDPASLLPVAARPALGSYRDPMYNHAPLDLDDPLGQPAAGQTWWGFPTKKETLSPYWTDPLKRLNDPAGTPMTTLASGTETANLQSLGLRSAGADARAALPPMTDALRGGRLGQPFAVTSNPAGDTPNPAGANSFTPGALPAPPPAPAEFFQAMVEEDLILTGVRSFDVKAYDPSLENYVDLGFMNMYIGTPPTVDVDFDGVADFWTMRTFAHEGRMPPLTTDYRSDPQAPAQNPNVGDDEATVVRLRRVWDSWSTDYTNTPTQLIGTAVAPAIKPALPSYPAPYPIPLRGVQITVRVVDPGNERVKQITIKQDFSSKL